MGVNLKEVAAAALESAIGIVAGLLWLFVVLPLEAVRVVLSQLAEQLRSVPRRRPACIAITGASSGIGEALAYHYARNGIHLALVTIPSQQQSLARVAAACRERGATVSIRACNVTDRSAMEAWLTETDDKQPVDMVIANAGVSEGTVGLPDVPSLGDAARAVFSGA